MSLLLHSAPASATPVFINELHYDNAGGDQGEFVEVAGKAGTNLDNWSIALYRDTGSVYKTIFLSGIIDDENNTGYGALLFTAGSTAIQNGSNDGLALVNGNTVVQFLSYEGTLIATSGVANGMTSIDIGVEEGVLTPVGTSLQLIGTGAQYGDFTWTGGPSSWPTASPGAINNQQILVPEPSTVTLALLLAIGFARRRRSSRDAKTRTNS